MKRKLTPLQMLGLCLVLCGGLLLAFSRGRLLLTQWKMQNVTARMEELLPARTPGVPGMYADAAMPVLEIDGTDYAALVEIPAFGRTLPVSASWEQRKLSQNPCRFWGSVYNGSLIIGGNDQPGQFDFCDQIHPGAEITVTTMGGEVFRYTVAQIHRAAHAEAQWLGEPGFDLTLFARGEFSLEYIAVRCVRK